MPEPMSDERLAELDSAYGEGGTKATAATKQQLRAVILELLDDARQQRRNEQQVRTDLAELREQIGTAADPDDVFEPGHTYRSENGYFEFHCERRIGEYALGLETVLKDWPVMSGTRFYRWASIGPSVGYHDVTGDPSSAPGD